MKHLSKTEPSKRLIISGGTFLGVVIFSGLVWVLSGGSSAAVGPALAYGMITFLFAISLAYLTWNWLTARLGRQNSIQSGLPAQTENASLQRRLDGMIKLNELLIDAQSEDQLVEKALEIISDVVGSSGASFVPYDEWGQPLRSYIYGAFPTPVLTPWTNHLHSPAVRHRCQTCISLQGDSLSECPLLNAPFTDIVRINCLPLKRNNRTVGVVNLYLQKDQEISQELNEYLLVMLNEMALALEITRLRNQELTTLRQLQLANSRPEELSSIVEKLVGGLSEVLDFHQYRAVFRPAEPAFSGFEFSSGDDPWVNSTEANALLLDLAQQRFASDSPAQIRRLPDGNGMLMLTFELPEGTIIGAALMTGAPFTELTPRQTALIETVTTQAALMVENERRRLDTEYRIVMQERIRLAREIHDSLAQTLSYLKLTSAQMQSQLAQGDLNRLAQSLQHSHEAISEAYLETRQAIDNLRLTPQQDVVLWLKQVAHNFEQANGIKVNLAVPGGLPRISLEIQAQLVRIVQEALSNIRKHSKASTVWINVREWNQNLVVDLSDDGIGFSADEIPEFSRHGLRGMRERSELIGAEFQIASQADHGTTIHIEIPVSVQETAA